MRNSDAGPPPIDCAPMRREHVAAVAAIEAALFPRPWNRDHFLHELTSNPFAECFVLLEERRVVGYACTWIVADEMQINKIAVTAARQRAGRGAALMRHLLERARERACRRVSLEVRTGNRAARALYDALGFRTVGQRKDYYGPGEHAVLMALDCG